jgi:hypothetical protein
VLLHVHVCEVKLQVNDRVLSHWSELVQCVPDGNCGVHVDVLYQYPAEHWHEVGLVLDEQDKDWLVIHW